MKYSVEDVKKIVGDKIDIQSVEFLGEGNHSAAFCINKNLVVKLPKHKKASKCLEREIKVLEKLQGRLNIDIPNVLLKWNFKNNDEEFICFVSRKLTGKKLSQKEFQNLSQDNIENCVTVIANFLFNLHNQKDVLLIKRKDLVLLHGDFSLNHILFDKNNLPCGVLDFGDTRVGKFMSEFIYLLDENDEEEFGKEFGEKVLKEYNRLKNKEI